MMNKNTEEDRRYGHKKGREVGLMKEKRGEGKLEGKERKKGEGKMKTWNEEQRKLKEGEGRG